MAVWTNFEDGRSRRSGVIDRKQKGYRRTDRPTDRQVQAKCALFFEGGHNNYNDQPLYAHGWIKFVT